MNLSEYDVMAAVERSHWWYGGMRAISAALLDPACARGGLRILDAGCGSAGNAPFLARYGEVVGVDLSMRALRYGHANLPGRLACASVLELPCPDASFDLVTSFDVLYHARVSCEEQALRECWRVLRPGGLLLIRLPAFALLSSRHDRNVHTRRRYRLAELCALLEQSGFAVERASYANSLLFLPRLAQRLLLRALPRLEHDSSDLALARGLPNELLRLPLALEACLLRLGLSFPVGTSAICLARKPAPILLEQPSPALLQLPARHPA
jgi:SAM-dependent methyltransferase